MPRRRDLRDVAHRIQSLLGAEDSVLVGGLAVAVHGYVRATDDVDILTRLGIAEVRRRLGAEGIATETLRGDILDGGFTCMRGMLDGVRFDVLFELVPIAWDRVAQVSIGGRRTLSVVDLDGLLRLKFRAGGPQDLMDAAHLLLRNPDRIPAAREAAAAYRVGDKLELWLNDRRVRAAVEAESGEGRPARRRK